MNEAKRQELESIYNQMDERVREMEVLAFVKTGQQERLLVELSKFYADTEKAPFAFLMQEDIYANQKICNRLVAIYIRLLTDFTYKFSMVDVIILSVQKRFITYVFEASGFYSADFLIKLLKDRAAEIKKGSVNDNQALMRSVLLSSLSELDMQDLVNLTLEKSEIAVVMILGLLLDRAPLTISGEAARKFLLEEFDDYSPLRALDVYRGVVSNVWMLCSYALSPRKHDLKKHLNQWFKRVHASRGYKLKPTGSVKMPGNTDNKPVMAVVSESFTSFHAMYRWYAPIIKKLKERYYMVIISLAEDVDDNSKTLFDQYIEVPKDEFALQGVFNACTPDIAYFPSVGMRAWSTCLANLRWAPIQVMSLGHPATTMSDCMDAVFNNTRGYGGPGYLVENQLIIESDIANLIEVHRNLEMPAKPTLSAEKIEIAVPCNVMKLNHQFMTALKEIERLAEKPIQFTFFPNELGVGYLSISKRIRNIFPNARVMKRSTYQGYLSALNQHHFALSPFPFGNATSAIDCLVLGIPFIGLIGGEPHSRSDYDVIAAFELEDYCIADSVENYVAGAVNLINNPDALAQMRELVASKGFLEQHFKGDNQLTEEFCNAMNWAFENQEMLRSVRGQAFDAAGRWKPAA